MCVGVSRGGPGVTAEGSTIFRAFTKEPQPADGLR